ncbi:hypothetical protein Bca101_067008 [Brassica carinata]
MPLHTLKDEASSTSDDESNGFTPRSFPLRMTHRHATEDELQQLRDSGLLRGHRDEVWKVNIPHTHLAHEKSDQNWMVVKGDKINFPGGGTHFHYGADKYIASMANMLNFSNNILNNGGRLRMFLDVGCGVASFGGYLLASDIMTMSLAPNDVHQNQIRFALERGIPAYLGVLGTKRLPDGILLLELDRVLRPGGYFAYSSPEAYAQDEEDLRIWREMSALMELMCWTIAAKRNQTVIWQKPMTNDCYQEREPGTQPPLCNSDSDPDAVYGETWRHRVDAYWDLLSPAIQSDTVRNIMDMKANMVSFAAALNDKDVWVMNVVPEDGPNTLKLIYDRGLMGAVHSWCEAFSTYPRTYDLLHAWDIITDVKKRGCSAEDLLLEMDHILRPSGFILIRDKQSVADLVKKYLKALHWEAVETKAASDSDHDSDVILIV